MGNYTFTATTPFSSVDTVIGVYNSSGNRVTSDDDSGAGTDSQATTSLLAGNVYYFGVTNWQGNLNTGGYTWSINGPDDDPYRDNDTLRPPRPGTSPGRPHRTGLRSGTTTGTASRPRDGLGTDFVRINFLHAQGDVDLALYDAAGTFLAASAGESDRRRSRSTAGRPAPTTCGSTATTGRRTRTTR